MKKLIYLNLVLIMFFCGCRAIDGGTTYFPTYAEKSALGAARILASPVSMVGFTSAEIEDKYPASAILFPFMACYTIPAGAVAMCEDILVGTVEMLTCTQCTDIRYPWESFSVEDTKEWRDNSRAVGLVMAGILLEATAEALKEQGSSTNTTDTQNVSYTQSNNNNNNNNNNVSQKKYKPRPRVQHSYCHGTGKCQGCHGKGYVGKDMRCTMCYGSGNCVCHGGWVY